ncbi:protein ALP1-like [Rutidosis leptorrhynchoides]|uniref:protein ALP1-like n=1 Tax=Rutidosis leptorrhynchoides TaxID=125765 RepID=UPI003A9A0730
MLEALTSYDGWFWHTYFGPAGLNNDINVLNQSDLFTELLAGEAPPCTYTVNGCTFNKGYYLEDGIYPEWATLVNSFRNPIDPKQSKFSKYQASARKDIERAFRVLQGRWTIVQHPARPYYIRKIRRIMFTCIILNNMIIEDNDRAYCGLEENYRPIRRARGTF